MSNLAGKPWWQSAGMIGGLTGIVVGMVQVYSSVTGAEIDLEALRGVVDNGLQLLFGLAGMVGGLLALYGRIKAILPIRKQVIPGVKAGDKMAVVPQPGPLPWLNDNQPPLKE